VVDFYPVPVLQICELRKSGNYFALAQSTKASFALYQLKSFPAICQTLGMAKEYSILELIMLVEKCNYSMMKSTQELASAGIQNLAKLDMPKLISHTIDLFFKCFPKFNCNQRAKTFFSCI
jgi:hypothetical protein